MEMPTMMSSPFGMTVFHSVQESHEPKCMQTNWLKHKEQKK